MNSTELRDALKALPLDDRNKTVVVAPAFSGAPADTRSPDVFAVAANTKTGYIEVRFRAY